MGENRIKSVFHRGEPTDIVLAFVFGLGRRGGEITAHLL